MELGTVSCHTRMRAHTHAKAKKHRLLFLSYIKEVGFQDRYGSNTDSGTQFCCSVLPSLVFLMHKMAAEAPVFTLAFQKAGRRKGEGGPRPLFKDACHNPIFLGECDLCSQV